MENGDGSGGDSGQQFSDFSKTLESILVKIDESSEAPQEKMSQLIQGEEHWLAIENLLEDLTSDGFLSEPFAALELELEVDLTFNIVELPIERLKDFHSVYNAVLSVLLGDEKPILTDDDILSRFQTVGLLVTSRLTPNCFRSQIISLPQLATI